MNYSVVTSRKAKNQLDDIKVKHADLLKNMQMQSLRVQAFNQQKAQEMQVKKQQEDTTSLARDKMNQDAQLKTMELAQGDREIDIMREAAKT